MTQAQEPTYILEGNGPETYKHHHLRIERRALLHKAVRLTGKTSKTFSSVHSTEPPPKSIVRDTISLRYPVHLRAGFRSTAPPCFESPGHLGLDSGGRVVHVNSWSRRKVSRSAKREVRLEHQGPHSRYIQRWWGRVATVAAVGLDLQSYRPRREIATPFFVTSTSRAVSA